MVIVEQRTGVRELVVHDVNTPENIAEELAKIDGIDFVRELRVMERSLWSMQIRILKGLKISLKNMMLLPFERPMMTLFAISTTQTLKKNCVLVRVDGFLPCLILVIDFFFLSVVL